MMKTVQKYWQQILAIFLIALLVYITKRGGAFQGGFMDDIHCWIRWAWANKENGIGNIYNTDSNYLPFYHYILWAFASLYDTREQLEAGIGNLKYITLAFEIGSLYLLYRWIDRRVPFLVILLVSLLNIAFLYNNFMWGQVDGILAALAFAVIYFCYNRQLMVAAVCMVLMMNFKLQGIIFVPIFALLVLNLYAGKALLQQVLKVVSTILLTQVVILLPFLFSNDGLTQLWQMLNSLVGYVPKVSSLAFNFWSLLYGQESDQMPDSNLFFAGLTFKQFGFFAFCATSFFALLPLLKNAWHVQFNKNKQVIPLIEKNRLSLMIAIVAVCFFYFNTQMHERYVFPAMIFIAAYSFDRKDFLPYILFSVAHFINMEFILRWAKFEQYENVWYFNRVAVAAVFGVVICYLFFRLFFLKQIKGLLNLA